MKRPVLLGLTCATALALLGVTAAAALGESVVTAVSISSPQGVAPSSGLTPVAFAELGAGGDPLVITVVIPWAEEGFCSGQFTVSATENSEEVRVGQVASRDAGGGLCLGIGTVNGKAGVPLTLASPLGQRRVVRASDGADLPMNTTNGGAVGTRDCGRAELSQGESVPTAYLECLATAGESGDPGTLTVLEPTIEGDQIVTTYTVVAAGTVSVRRDSTADRFAGIGPKVYEEICTFQVADQQIQLNDCAERVYI